MSDADQPPQRASRARAVLNGRATEESKRFESLMRRLVRTPQTVNGPERQADRKRTSPGPRP